MLVFFRLLPKVFFSLPLFWNDVFPRFLLRCRPFSFPFEVTGGVQVTPHFNMSGTQSKNTLFFFYR